MRDPSAIGRPVTMSTDDIAPVWVLDDPAEPRSPDAIAVAERLGVPHLRVPLSWRWQTRFAGLSRRGSLAGLQARNWPFTAPRGPALTVSAGPRAAAVALWLRQTFGTRLVHVGVPSRHVGQFDLVVAGQDRPFPRGRNILPCLGRLHRLSPLVLAQARVAWAGRLSHLPRPVVALLAGGSGGHGPLRPAAAQELGRQVARAAASMSGSVMATTTASTGAAAADALAAGLAPCMHLLYRWGEPDENPYTAMIALADVIVVTGGSGLMLSEACAGEAPVFVASLGDDRAHRRLHQSFYQAGQARPLAQVVTSWTRVPLDEAGRAAAEIRSRMSVGPQAAD